MDDQLFPINKSKLFIFGSEYTHLNFGNPMNNINDTINPENNIEEVSDYYSHIRERLNEMKGS